MTLSPAERARADQVRAALNEGLGKSCACGECPTDEQLRALLALDDRELLTAIGSQR